MRLKRKFFPFALVAIWLVFTMSLSGWWIIFALETVKELADLKDNGAIELLRRQKMLLGEGSFLFLLLFSGALALVYYIFHELKEREKVKEFFSTFTHELKTPLASLKLQAEVLKEGIKERDKIELLERLLSDINRLTLQLENSLYLANLRSRELLIESVNLSDLLAEVRRLWPRLKIINNRDCRLEGDLRVLQSIIQNIVHNSLVHGQATEIQFKVEPFEEKIKLSILDNGQGFRADRGKLGEPFVRFYSGSGSGIGLYLMSVFIERMGGKIIFPETIYGFEVVLILKGKLLNE